MTATLTNEARWIARRRELEEAAAYLVKQPILAVDTESNSLYAYRERVCLVQISTREADFLIDPLALDDLAGLAPIFADPKIEKVFHAAEYDVICLRRDFGFQFANLFDTMAAARILGWKAFGLGNILESEFGVSLDKRHQRANWGQRPLPPGLRDYARMDSHYLIELRDRLRAELEARGRLPLAEEDFRRLCEANGGEQAQDDETLCRVRGAADLSPRQYTILFELCQYRDQVARQMDRPLFKVMGNKTLVAIAEAPPSSLEGLRQLPGMSPTQVSRHGNGLLRAVQRGLEAPIKRVKKARRMDEGTVKRLEALREWRKETARALDVESDVVLPRDLLLTLAVKHPQDADSLRAVMNSVPWRLEQYGGMILEVLREIDHGEAGKAGMGRR